MKTPPRVRVHVRVHQEPAGAQEVADGFLLLVKLLPPSREVVAKCAFGHLLQARDFGPFDPQEARKCDALRKPNSFTQRQALGSATTGVLFRQDPCQL